MLGNSGVSSRVWTCLHSLVRLSWTPLSPHEAGAGGLTPAQAGRQALTLRAAGAPTSGLWEHSPTPTPGLWGHLLPGATGALTSWAAGRQLLSQRSQLLLQALVLLLGLLQAAGRQAAEGSSEASAEVPSPLGGACPCSHLSACSWASCICVSRSCRLCLARISASSADCSSSLADASIFCSRRAFHWWSWWPGGASVRCLPGPGCLGGPSHLSALLSTPPGQTQSARLATGLL